MSPEPEAGKGHFRVYISKHYKNIWLILLYSLILGTIAYGISRLPVFQDIEQRTLDLRFQLAPIPDQADTNIVLIAIDQGSLDYARSLGQGWPFPRSFYALVTDYLNQAEPQAILYDILFDEPDFYRGDEDGDAMDAAFAQAMSAGGKTALVMTLSEEPSGLDPALERFASDRQLDELPLYQGAEL
ncbi:MAG TPA: CHASE2 domain-containing protein, partial [Candidatus Cloacimonadota bacterium]|nr:CHASE2 domain-containing protein [Candidatus Cloacimonadota bacterium]